MFPIQPARFGGGNVPVIRRGKYKTSEAIVKGSVLGIDSNGELVVLTDDANNPANGSIVGIATEAAGSAPGYDIGQVDSDTVYTGRAQEVSYAKANRTTEFWGMFSDDGITFATPAQTNIGESYKLSKATNGEWFVDTGDQSPANVIITDIDIDSKRVMFKFTEASLAEA